MTDTNGSEKCIFFSSMLKSALLNNPLRKCLPLPLQTDVWMNLVIDMGDLMPFFFDGAQFASLDRIELEAACRLRRIFTTSFKPSEDHFIVPGLPPRAFSPPSISPSATPHAPLSISISVPAPFPPSISFCPSFPLIGSLRSTRSLSFSLSLPAKTSPFVLSLVLPTAQSFPFCFSLPPPCPPSPLSLPLPHSPVIVPD